MLFGKTRTFCEKVSRTYAIKLSKSQSPYAASNIGLVIAHTIAGVTLWLNFEASYVDASPVNRAII